MPHVRPFRALRYSPEVVHDLGAVVAPPYDVIGPEEQQVLLARSPANVVRLDLPPIVPGEDPDERYRRAARLLTEWRSDGTLRRDPRPSLYPYEQSFALPGSDTIHVRRGLFGRLVLEPFGPGAGVRPHERTLSAPKEDRYRLLRATGVNTSPVVALYEDPSGEAARWLEAAITAGAPVVDVTDDAGVRHRLWVADPGEVADRVGSGPITILDGHHRYETALRYRDERLHGAPPEPEPAWGQILTLFLEPVAGPVTVLATHRVVRGLGEDGVAALVAGLASLFEVHSGVGADELRRTFSPADEAPGGAGRFGLWTRHGGAILHARREALAALVTEGGPAVRRLDVTMLGAVLASLAGIDAAAVDAGERIAYTKDVAEAIAWVDDRHAGADAAFLLDPTPAADIAAVAADGDVMPQKSTYIYPKALTGLVINPLE